MLPGSVPVGADQPSATRRLSSLSSSSSSSSLSIALHLPRPSASHNSTANTSNVFYAEESMPSDKSRGPIVHTRSVDNVLSPIADQVSQLILLDEQARMHKRAMPDLTQAAEAIGLAVRNLCSVGQEAMASGDDQLKSRMPPATEQLQTAGKLFLDAAMALRLDPLSDTARAMLIQAARGLLAGTTNVLMTFDEYEVRKIVTLGEAVIELLTAGKEVTSLEDLVSVLRSVSESVIALAQLAEARHEELMNASHRSRLVVANEALRKASPLLVSAMRTYIQNMGSEQAKAGRDYAISQVMQSVHEIIVVVSSTDLDDNAFLESPGQHAKALEEAETSLLSGTSSAEALNSNIAKILDNAQGILTACKDESKKDQLTTLAVQIKECVAVFTPSKADELRRHLAQFDSKLKSIVIDEMSRAHLHSEVPSALSTLYDATLAEAPVDESFLKENLVLFREHTKELCVASQHVASTSMDTKRVKMVEVSTQHLEALSGQVCTAFELVARKPDSKAAREHLTLLKDAYDHRVSVLKSVVSSMQDTTQVVQVSAENITNEIEKVRETCQQGDVVAAEQIVDDIQKRAGHLCSIATSEVENSEDPNFRAPLQLATVELRTAYVEYAEQIRAVIKKPADPVGARQLSVEEDRFKSALNNVQKAMRGELLEDGLRRPGTSSASNSSGLGASSDAGVLGAEDEEVEVVTVKEAQLAESSPATRAAVGAIGATAKELKAASNRWSEKNNPIVKTSGVVADLMADMSRFASKTEDGENKSMLISTAKSIAENAKEMCQHALKVASSCADRRISTDLAYLQARLATLGTQIKIIAAVRAASADDNEEAHALLLKNAQNLAETVMRTVRCCESASLKPFATAANAATAAIRWKRKVVKVVE